MVGFHGLGSIAKQWLSSKPNRLAPNSLHRLGGMIQLAQALLEQVARPAPAGSQ